MVDPGTAGGGYVPASTSTLRANRCEHEISIYECPKITIENTLAGVTSIFLGKITIHIYSKETRGETK